MKIEELNRAAENYFSDKGRIEERFITTSTLKLISPYILNKRVLQLGLGNGFIAKQIDSTVACQIVIEGSSRLINNFKENLKNTKVIKSYFEDFFIEGEFDVILANHVLEHVEDPTKVLGHLRQFLCKEGKMLITVPNAMSIHRRIGMELGMINTTHELNDSDKLVGHKRVFDINALRKVVSNANYNIVKEQGFLIKMVSLQQIKDWGDELLSAIFRVSLHVPLEVCSNIFLCIEKNEN